MFHQAQRAIKNKNKGACPKINKAWGLRGGK